MEIDPTTSNEFVIDTSKPLEWERKLSYDSTQHAFDAISRMARTRARARLLRVFLKGEDPGANAWIQVQTGKSIWLGSEDLKQFIEVLRSRLPASGQQITLEIAALHFETGSYFEDWIKETKAEYKREEVRQ